MVNFIGTAMMRRLAKLARQSDPNRWVGTPITQENEVPKGHLVRIQTTGVVGECWFGAPPRRTDFWLDGQSISGWGDRSLARSGLLAAAFGHGRSTKTVEVLAPPDGINWGTDDGHPCLEFQLQAGDYVVRVRSCAGCWGICRPDSDTPILGLYPTESNELRLSRLWAYNAEEIDYEVAVALLAPGIIRGQL